MTEEHNTRPQEVALYIGRANQMLRVAVDNLDAGYCASAVNRAYYAIFYAANAMLSTQKLARGRHSGVISAFRERFVKTGLIEAEYSRIYGRVTDDRHLGDCEIRGVVTAEQAERGLKDTQRLVIRVKAYLKKEGWM